MKTVIKQERSLQILLEAMGNRLRELRLKKGYSSHVDFARHHNLPTIQYWRMEKGKANMTLKSLHKILYIHGIQIEEFFSGLNSD